VGTSADPGFDGGPVENTLIERNLVIRSGSDGIHNAKASSTATRNRALRNGRWGINAIAGTTDGGGNRAAGNGEPMQCSGVAC
jgi:hypothetical protein